MAIRKEPIVQQPETEEIRYRIPIRQQQNQEEETEIESSKSKPIETPQKKETAPEIAKEEKEYTIEDLKQNPVAMTAFLLDLHAQQIQQREKAKTAAERKQPQRKRRGTPEQLAQYYCLYCPDSLGETQSSNSQTSPA